MLKLKNIRKRLGDEVYPLWLENTINFNSELIDWETGLLHYKGFKDSIIICFNWKDTPQGNAFWRLEDWKWNSAIRLFKTFWFCRDRPYTELEPTEYSKSWVFHKEYGRTCIAYLLHNGTMQVHAGCFEGSLEEFETRAKFRYGDDDTRNYAKHIAWLKDLQTKYNEARSNNLVV